MKFKKRKVDFKTINENKRFCNTLVINELAEELEIPELLVQAIQEAQSKYHAQVTKGGGLETVKYVALGKFKINPRQLQMMMTNGMKG